MAHYIDKSALVAEIERRIKEHKRYANSNRNNMIEEDVAILSFIDTLEVKEVQEEPAHCTGIGEPKEESGVLGEMIKEMKEEPKDPNIDLDEEPVSKVWHDSNIEQPDSNKPVVIWNPKYTNGEIIHRCDGVYSDRIWAYVFDLLNLTHSVTKISDQEESEWLKELQDKLNSPSKEEFEKLLAKYYKYDEVKEPVSEELEKAAVEAFKQIVDSDKNNFLEIFKAGAQWGKHQAMAEIQSQSMALAHGCPKEPVSEDLEKAAVNAFKQIVDSDKNNFLEIFRAGAEWQKKQMVAKAIDGVVTFDYYDSGNKTYGCVAHDSFCLEDFGLKDRDKVKVIVIKED